MASGRKPLFWNTERNWSHEERDQGFAPSDTRRSLKEAKLISRWSLVANSPQWRSLDLTMAMLAVKICKCYLAIMFSLTTYSYDNTDTKTAV